MPQRTHSRPKKNTSFVVGDEVLWRYPFCFSMLLCHASKFGAAPYFLG